MSLTNSERENSKMERGTEFDKEIENEITGGFTFPAIRDPDTLRSHFAHVFGGAMTLFGNDWI